MPFFSNACKINPQTKCSMLKKNPVKNTKCKLGGPGNYTPKTYKDNAHFLNPPQFVAASHEFRRPCA